MFLRNVRLAFLLLVAACGGGGGGDSSQPVLGTAEGLWLGTTNTNRAITGLVLDDGTYYFIYSVAGSPQLVAGFVQGNATSFNGTFLSGNAVDFNLSGSGILPATISGNYVSRTSLNGTVAYTTAGSTTFTSTFSANYDTAPAIATIVGTYSGATVAINGPTPPTDFATLTIVTAGTVSGSTTGGCTFTGTVAPRTKGNAYNISITFGAAPCVFASQTLAGLAYFDAATKALYVAAPNSARTQAAFFLVTKP